MKTCYVRSIVLFALLLLAGIFVLLFVLNPLDREYALRLVRMGESDVKDYLRFPERGIENPAEAFVVEAELHPEWFETIGEYFHYNNYHPILEGMILERVTGMPVAKYLEEKIWQPLGMEHLASWSLDSEETAFEKMESGINARAVDFAKFGLLFLNYGRWEGQQIISKAWVKESTAPNPNDRRESPNWPEYRQNGGYYKYHWWGNVRPDGHYDYTAAGNFGQYIYVCTQKNLVIARFGEDDEPVDSFRHVLYALEQMVP